MELRSLWGRSLPHAAQKAILHQRFLQLHLDPKSYHPTMAKASKWRSSNILIDAMACVVCEALSIMDGAHAAHRPTSFEALLLPSPGHCRDAPHHLESPLRPLLVRSPHEYCALQELHRIGQQTLRHGRARAQSLAATFGCTAFGCASCMPTFDPSLLVLGRVLAMGRVPQPDGQGSYSSSWKHRDTFMRHTQVRRSCASAPCLEANG